MRNIMIVTFFAFLLTACAPMIRPDGMTDEMAMRDDRECTFESRQYALQMGVAGNPVVISEEYRRCLRKRGWSG